MLSSSTHPVPGSRFSSRIDEIAPEPRVFGISQNPWCDIESAYNVLNWTFKSRLASPLGRLLRVYVVGQPEADPSLFQHRGLQQ